MEGADSRVRHGGARHGTRAGDEGAPARPGRRGAGRLGARPRCRDGHPGDLAQAALPRGHGDGARRGPRGAGPRSSQSCRRTVRDRLRGGILDGASVRERLIRFGPLKPLLPSPDAGRQAQHARRGAPGAEARREPARRRLGKARRPADGRALPFDPGLRRLRGHRREPARRPAVPLRGKRASRTRRSAGGSGRPWEHSLSTARESRPDGLGRARLLCPVSRSRLRPAVRHPAAAHRFDRVQGDQRPPGVTGMVGRGSVRRSADHRRSGARSGRDRTCSTRSAPSMDRARTPLA